MLTVWETIKNRRSIRKFSSDDVSDEIIEQMLGNQALFVRRDEIEQAWTWVDSILEAWKQSSEPPEPYQAGTWGPVDSIGLLARENRSWYESKTVKKK